MPEPRWKPFPAAHVYRLVFLLAVFAVVLVLGLSTDEFERITPRGVHRWVRGAGVWAPAAYVAGFLVRPLTLLPLTLWLVTGGVAFGWLWGALYALIGVNAGAAVGFFTARGLGRDLVNRLLRRRPAAQPRPRVWSARLVLSLQLFPFMPHDLLNAAAGVSAMPYWRFLLGSALGTLPFVVLYTYAGSVLVAPGSFAFYAAFAALAALSIASFVASRRMRAAESLEPTESAAPGAGETLPEEVPAR
jgi:uncharacterized membrane protein YdjX (TVP38/TMEM64 family)